MYQKILVANRGEIARRIMKTCRSMGIETVAIFSEADKENPYVAEADEAYLIGPPPVRDSYLKAGQIIELALKTAADAVHPGYGFLSEEPAFAQACMDRGIAFIGPSPQAMKAMGKKIHSRKLMADAGIPIIGGCRTALRDSTQAVKEADMLGYPVLLKASGGGGGIGMEVVRSPDDIAEAFGRCQSRAKACFGDEAVYLESYLQSPRHIEIQIVADRHKNVWHLGERDCSVQRRNQKVIEESPSVAINEALRRGMCEVGVKAAAAIGYDSVGTVEMLLDRNNNYYFLEMNTRIQVEHGVTEMRTGEDLVALQIMASAGELLLPKGYHPSGHSMECRIYAENPVNFRPSCGVIKDLHFPEGHRIRVDHSLKIGLKISPFYDPLIAKVMSFGKDRRGCIEEMRQALKATQLEGIATNMPFLLRVLEHRRFVEEGATTALADEILSELKAA